MVRLGDDKKLKVTGVGLVVIESKDGHVSKLANVLYVPQLARNLLGVGQLMTTGYTLNFSHGVCTIIDDNNNNNNILAHVRMTVNRLFLLDAWNIACANAVFSIDDEFTLWHRRFSHLNTRSLLLLAQSQLVKDLPNIALGAVVRPCEGCAMGKQTCHQPARRAMAPLELVHGDLVGPMQTPSLGGNRYIFLLTDDYSRYTWAYFMQRKSDVFEPFKVFRQMQEK